MRLHDGSRVLNISPRDLGDPSFRVDLGLEYNYLAGAMANGIASEALVISMAKIGRAHV